MSKKQVKALLHNLGKENKLPQLEQYCRLLFAENKKINLISRRTTENEFWLKHILDSLLPFSKLKLKLKKQIILDFGSGGGLPGIPLKILFPETTLYLLDSKLKKTNFLIKVTKKLDLEKCYIIRKRLENLNNDYSDMFDIILCRSVKILPAYRKKMLELLKAKGKIYLYKGKKMDDIKQFANYKIYDYSRKELGTRKLIEINNG